MIEKPNFLQAADPKDFVGHRNHINDYRRNMIKFKSSKSSPTPIMFVVGPHGSGKTSLLRILGKTASGEGITTLKVNIPPNIETSFKELHKILKEFRVEQGGFTSFFKRSKDTDIPLVKSERTTVKAINNFKKNYKDRELNTPILITIDDLGLAFELKAPYVLSGIVRLADELGKIIPVAFIFAISQNRWEQIQDEFSHHPNIFLGKMEYSDAEILLRKIGNEVLLTERGFRSDIIKLGDRSPFNLVFAVDVVKYFTLKYQKDNEKDNELSNNQIETIKKESIPYLRNIDYMGFLIEYYDMEEKEIKLLQRFMENNTPIVTVAELTKMGIPEGELTPLIQLGLIDSAQDKYYRFTSLSLFERAGRKSEVDIISQLELMINLITIDYKEGYKPTQGTIKRLTDLTTGIKGNYPNAKPIATKMEQLFKLSMNKQQYYAAYKFALATEKIYSICADKEGQGVFLEEAARKFIDTKKLHYAKELFERSMAVYSHSEWKMKSNAREAANIYADLAKQAQKNDQQELTRAFLWKAITLLDRAGEKKRLETLVNRAINTYTSKEDTKTHFFRQMIHE